MKSDTDYEKFLEKEKSLRYYKDDDSLRMIFQYVFMRGCFAADMERMLKETEYERHAV